MPQEASHEAAADVAHVLNPQADSPLALQHAVDAAVAALEADEEPVAEPPSPDVAPEPCASAPVPQPTVPLHPYALLPSSVLPPPSPVPIPIPLPIPLPPEPEPAAVVLPEPQHEAAPPQQLPAQPMCTVCTDAPLEGAFMPCRHLAACFACGSHVMRMGARCPVCREPCAGFERFFICAAD